MIRIPKKAIAAILVAVMAATILFMPYTTAEDGAPEMSISVILEKYEGGVKTDEAIATVPIEQPKNLATQIFKPSVPASAFTVETQFLDPTARYNIIVNAVAQADFPVKASDAIDTAFTMSGQTSAGEKYLDVGAVASITRTLQNTKAEVSAGVSTTSISSQSFLFRYIEDAGMGAGYKEILGADVDGSTIDISVYMVDSLDNTIWGETTATLTLVEGADASVDVVVTGVTVDTQATQ